MKAKTRFRNTSRVTLSLLLAIVLVACGSSGGTSSSTTSTSPGDTSTTTGEPTPAEPVSITMAAHDMPPDLDPHSSSAMQHFRIWRLYMDPLVTVGADGQLEAALAESWEIIEPTVWQFKLRQGVTFHNGEPFDADSVVATVEYAQAEDTASYWAQRLTAIESVEVVDEYTVNIHTTEPSPLLGKNLAVLFMLPPDYLAETGKGPFGQAPIGTGPFEVAEFSADQQIVLERFDDHWRGEAAASEIVINKMLEPASRVAALQTGEADMAWVVGVEQLDALEAEGFVTESSIVAASWLIMLYTNNEILASTEVRQALNYATNKEELNEFLFAGRSRVLQGQMVGPNANGYQESITGYAYDPDKARELLASAGHPDGFTIQFNAPAGRYYKDREIAEAVCNQWAQVGVTCELDFLESSVWSSRLVDATLGPISAAPWQTGPQLDLEVPMVNFQGSSPRQITDIARINELYEAVRTTIDEEERDRLLAELAQAVFEDPPVVFLMENADFTAMSDELEGVVFAANHSFDPMTITKKSGS